MAGSYRKLKNGKWELCVSLGFDIMGKRIRKFKNVEAKNQKEAEILLAEFITQCTRLKHKNFSNLLLREFYDLWIEDYGKTSLRKKTLYRYKGLWKRVDICLGHIKLTELKPTYLIEFYKLLKEDGTRNDGKPGGLSTSSVRQHHFLLSSMYETAIAWEIVESNPCSKVKLAKMGHNDRESRVRTEKSIYSLEQTKELIQKIETADIKFQVLIYLAIFTGCRREELLGLEWKDINFETGEINIERASQYTPDNGTYEDDLKTLKSKRSCFVSKKLLKLISDYKIVYDKQKDKMADKWIDSGRLFVQKDGRAMHPDTPTKFFNKFLKKNNLPHTKLHNLRHVHSSILLLMGMDLNSVADQMGHADIQMIVKRYSHNIRKKHSDTVDFLEKALEFDDDAE